MLTAAMRGELGPLAQAVARYQVERRIRNEMEKLQAIRDELKNIQASKGSNVSQGVSLYSEYREMRHRELRFDRASTSIRPLFFRTFPPTG